MKYPEGYIFTYPGLPSLAVSYAHTSDFFFSGHVGVTTFLALENYSNRCYFLATISAISAIFEFWVMTFLRGHYTIDLLFGLAIAHYLWIISGKLAPYVDAYIGPEIPEAYKPAQNGTRMSIK